MKEILTMMKIYVKLIDYINFIIIIRIQIFKKHYGNLYY